MNLIVFIFKIINLYEKSWCKDVLIRNVTIKNTTLCPKRLQENFFFKEVDLEVRKTPQ